MNPRERSMAVTLIAIILVLGGGVLGYLFIWLPYQENEAAIEKLTKERRDEKRAQVALVRKEMPKLEKWRLQSLPGEVFTPPTGKGNTAQTADIEKAYHELRDKYIGYLKKSLTDRGIDQYQYPKFEKVETKVPGTAPNAAPPYVTLVFKLDITKAKYENLVAWMADFQNAPLLQRIKDFTITQPQGKEDKRSEYVTAQFTIEALVVQGAKQRQKTLAGIDERLVILNALAGLRRAPVGLPLVPWAVGPTGPLAVAPLKDKATPRKYPDIARDTFNIFSGPQKPKDIIVYEKEKPPPEIPIKKLPEKAEKVADVISTYRLTDISGTDMDLVAHLYEPGNKNVITISNADGEDTFALLLDCKDAPVVEAALVKFEGTRGLVFRVQLAAYEPAESATKPYPKARTIYALHKNDLDALVKARTAKASEADRLYKVSADYWKELQRDKVVTVAAGKVGPFGGGGSGKGDFAFKHDLVCGQVIATASDFVTLRLNERYCGFRAGRASSGITAHLGFCRLNGKLIDALKSPVADKEAKSYLTSSAANGIQP